MNVKKEQSSCFSISMQEECSWAGSNGDIEKENKNIIKYSKQLTGAISRLQRSIAALALLGMSQVFLCCYCFLQRFHQAY